MSGIPLVSIVSPCFNGAAYIDRFFNSVFVQTWTRIELIFVDDGSVDDTLEIAESWREKLEGRGISFRVFTHPNGGQASALNLGLAYVSGKYLMWPDSDDLLDPRNIEVKVNYLESHPAIGLVVCDVVHVMEDDLDHIVHKTVFDDSHPRLFDGLIRENSESFCSGIAYMARTDALFNAIGGRRIYESRSGQNWQLLFPLTYHYDCGFVHENLATYVVRVNSHSRSYNSLADQLKRTYELEDIILNVLPSMGMSDADLFKYMEYARNKYLPLRFKIAVRLGDKELAREIKTRLDAIEGKSWRREALMAICKTGLYRAFNFS